tara:strand:- start:94 stop:759 length:666 start_codon:yes stop_codon:yes gene_type:complete
MTKNYLKKNFHYWQRGYEAPNLEAAVFRFYGKFLKKKKLTKKNTLLDFGCGQGAAVNFFNKQNINSYGADISRKDISVAKKRYKKYKKKYFHIENLDDLKKKIKMVDVILCVQSLYYLSDKDLYEHLSFFKSILKRNGIIYATMISTKSSLYNNRKTKDGLSLVNKDNVSKVKNHYINFTRSYNDLEKKFSLFKVVQTGYYSFCIDKNNDVNHHYLIIAKK